ncbi:MAG: cation:dicarboxylase symporter family transporter, partial [Simkaniaceae bacterium]|nr:cation:dicarboxylase symporter family transporter [Simkaniaceae bacterium]
ENPIYDLANNVVPAIAIFGIIMGIALMHLKVKEPLISFLERVNNTIEMLLGGITKVAPIGIAALFANAFGTVYLEDLRILAYYLIPLVVLTLLLTFWALPALLMSFTPLKYREIIKELKGTCLLAFVIGSPSIAIPYINQSIKRYGTKYQINDENFHSTSQTIVPFSYTFAQVGNFLILFFIFHLSSYYHHPIDWVEKVLMSILTIPMSFGGPEMAVSSISFLIEKLGFPSDLIKLYSNTSLISQNFEVLLSVSSIVTFALLLLFGYYRLVKLNLRIMLKHFLCFFLVMASCVLGVNYFFKNLSPTSYRPEKLSLEKAYRADINATVYRDASFFKKPQTDLDPLVRILSTRILRVGYFANSPPFTYFNEKEELVGYNIVMAYKFAKDLGVKLEFIPCTSTNVQDLLSNKIIDIAMGPMIVTAYGEGVMNFPRAYLSSENVLLVPKDQSSDYVDLDRIKLAKNLKIGSLNYFQGALRHYFQEAEIVPIADEVEFTKAFASKKIDALFLSKELAIAYAMEHPNFVTMDYSGNIGSGFLSYPVENNTFNLLLFLNSWLTLQKDNGFEKEQYAYWMEGKS